MFLRKLLFTLPLLTGIASPVVAVPAVAAPAVAEPAVAEPRNIILITIDTARADRMGFLGSKAGLTPNLDALARQSVVFSRAYAHVPLTTPSHATILTGTYPQFNHLDDLGTALSKEIPFLPDILRHHGYHTGAFVGAQVLDPKSAAVPGFDRGFDTYDAGFHSRQPGEDRYHSVERRAEVVVEHALGWISQHSHGPFFVWVHLYDPHDPYDPPPPFKARYAASPYDGEIAYVDFALGKLLGALHSRGLYEGTLIAIAADHGEAFGEHGEQSHGFFLYDETLHVPLMMKLPGERAAGLRIVSRVGLVDLAPTMLQEVGIEAPVAMQGETLLNLMKPGTGATGAATPAQAALDRPAYAETDYPHRAFGWSALYSLRAGRYLYIDAPERELYDQSADPEALHNLATSSKAVADTMSSQLEEFRRKTAGAATAQPAIDPQQVEQLQALGYVTGFAKPGSDKSVSDAREERGPDPKRKIKVANLLHQALLEMEDDRYRDAIPQLEQVLKEEPDMPLANLQLGRAWSGLENYDKALPWLRKAVELTPESGRAHFELGMALAETEDWAGAASQMEAALVHIPDSDEMYFDLATAYEHLGRVPDAIKSYQTALQLNPNQYRANLMFGRLLGMRDDPQAALPYSQKAVQLQPQSPDAHKFLANVYTELGQEENARRERAEAQRLSVPDKAQ
jgi:arylsulfatase A-like enzyme/Tfp pilus assembly protein PilF